VGRRIFREPKGYNKEKDVWTYRHRLTDNDKENNQKYVILKYG